MSVVSFLCALIASITLAISGVLKLGDAAGVRLTMINLSVPAQLRRGVLPGIFPGVELALGLGSLAATGSTYYALATASLLLYLAFLALVIRASASPAPISCSCFGSLTGGPIGRFAVLRNIVLTLCATLAILLPGGPRTWWGDHATSGLPWLPAVAAGLAAIGIRLLVVPAVERRRASRKAASVLEHRLVDAHGASIGVREFLEPATVLVFFSNGCGACQRAVPWFRWWPSRLPDDLDLQPVLVGTPETFSQNGDFGALAPYAWYDLHGELADALQLPGFPGAAYLGPSAPAGGEVSSGVTGISAMLERHGADLRDPPYVSTD